MSLETVLKETAKAKAEEKARIKVRQRAIAVMNECRVAATSAIAQFYGSYTPTVYNRQRSFYNSPQLTLSKKNDLHYSLEIRFSSDLGGGHHDPDEYIYNRVIYAGIHGTTRIAVTTPIWEIFGSFLDYRFGK